VESILLSSTSKTTPLLGVAVFVLKAADDHNGSLVFRNGNQAIPPMLVPQSSRFRPPRWWLSCNSRIDSESNF
jgi:hypothetical protein